MREIIHSVGIDVGTTTTQVLFSRLVLENTASITSVPKVKIVERTVAHAGPVHFTPLLDLETIDADALRRLVEDDYAAAGIRPKDISAGAVIITGETARKKNAEAVSQGLAGLAGEFVVTTAGSDLESLLSGRGAGTSVLSRKEPGVFANLDIGGGTTNIALFKGGEAVDTSCLDIGGRHIIIDVERMRIVSITPQYKRLLASMELPLREDDPARVEDLRKLTDRCAQLMAEMLHILPRSRDLEPLITNRDFTSQVEIRGLTFSGGVAAALNNLEKRPPQTDAELFAYGDIGVLQALSLRGSFLYRARPVFPATETIRATVVGVGTQMMELSGSTVFYSRADILPLKNLPVLKIGPEEEAAGGKVLSEAIRSKSAWFRQDGGDSRVAVALRGKANPSYDDVPVLARAIADGAADALTEGSPLVVLLEHDLAKSLGNALGDILGKNRDVICLDAVDVESGDYIDIGKPVAGGRVLPVMVKTLLFGR
jgi:ethanolamine utilization protein EutA